MIDEFFNKTTILNKIHTVFAEKDARNVEMISAYPSILFNYRMKSYLPSPTDQPFTRIYKIHIRVAQCEQFIISILLVEVTQEQSR